MLKTLLDKEIAISAEKLFNARYDPKNGRLMQQSEIFEFLSDRRVPVETLPTDLRSALKKNRVIGVLVSGLDGPIALNKTEDVPIRLDQIHAMLLAWEREESGSGGIGGLWLNGERECPDNQPKCANFNLCADCGGKICLCVGLLQCPPCQECKRCSGPNVANPESQAR